MTIVEQLKLAREAIQELFDLIETGVLVRNTAEDYKPGFGMRQLPFVMALKKAQSVLDLATDETLPIHIPSDVAAPLEVESVS